VSAAPLFGAAQGPEAQPITLNQAIERALGRHPALQIQRRAIEEAQGQRTTAGLLPNPALSYSREDLRLSGREDGEWTLSAGLPLNFLWERQPRIDVASARVEAEQFALANEQRLVRFEAQKAFVECDYADRSHQAWQRAAAAFQKAAAASRARLAEGDVAGYDQQRIALEHLRYQKAEAEARVELLNSRRRLAFLLDPAQSEAPFETVADLPSGAPDIPLENLLAQAMQNRPDLQAVRAALRSQQAGLSAVRRQRLPAVSVSGGYKKQVDGFKGAVVQVNLGLPVFDRNQGEVVSASAAVQRQTLSVGLLEKQIALEVRQAYDRHRLYREQVETFLKGSSQPPAQVLEVAQFSYAEGEMSLVELLDGVRAYSEAFQATYDLLLKYQLSLFELEKAAATPIAGL
jgi:cobalt-zinc-cadmium efflux system outer membrane protein